jgi:hypothetical protein
MTNKELIEILQSLPLDAEVCRGYTEGTKDKPGWTLFDLDVEDIKHHNEVWAYGNASPKPPTIQKNVIIIDWY